MGAELLPQRARAVRDRAEPQGYLIEPAWVGVRTLIRVGHSGSRFVGYEGSIQGPRELYEAIVAVTHCTTAIIDGVMVPDWSDDPDLEVDSHGGALVRRAPVRQIFAAFDLLEVDGESLLDAPLLERKRHLEGLVTPSLNVRLTSYVTRGLVAWKETLVAQGFRRAVLKNWNSTYAAGRVTDDWIVVEKINPSKEERRSRL